MEWWRTAVIYQIYPRSFADSDGDGVGDLPGITSRLTHLSDLGVDAVWMSPFYRSPMVDGGYDVSDYRDVDPLFGTLADFDALLAEAHRLGLRVIVDIVPNHTSSLHPWFTSGLRDRYVFARGTADAPPNDWRSLFGGPAWSRAPHATPTFSNGSNDNPDPAGDGAPSSADDHGGDDTSSSRSGGSDGGVGGDLWYLHLFDPAQPDLNWDNPDVRAEFDDILRFWLDRGVDGFRVDVAHGLVKPDFSEISVFDQDRVHEIYRGWRKILDSYPGERMAVAEVFDTEPRRVARYVAADELHQAFNFDFLEAPWDPAVLREIIDASIAAAAEVGAPPTWVLSNHDRRRHVTRFGDGVPGLRRARAAALLMLALPGSAYLYQGEELGLPEVLDLPDAARTDPQWVRSGGAELGRDGCRVPLPWSGDAPPFGFGPGDSSWLPMPADWAARTVEAQRADPDSMLNLYRTALRLRRPSTTLTWRPAPDGVLCFETDGYLVATNFGAAATRHGEVAPSRSEIATSRGEVATSRSEIATSRGGDANIRSEIATSRSEIATSHGGDANIRSEIATSRSEIPIGHDQVAAGRGGIANSLGGIASSLGGIATSLGGVATGLGGSAFRLPRKPVLASSPVGGTLPPDTTVWMELD